MSYRVYVDVLFVVNLIMNYCILRLTCLAGKKSSKRIRCLLGGIIGALGVCLFVILPVRKSVSFAVVWQMFIGTLMVKIGCKIKGIGEWIRMIITMYVISFLWGGMFFALRYSPASITWRTFLLLSLVSYEVLSCILRLMEGWRSRGNRYYSVTLYVDEKKVAVKGLYDTGNLLLDPLTNKPVSVADAKAVSELFTEPPETDPNRMPHYVPYRAVGTKQGVLLAVTLDAMCIEIGQEIKWIEEPILALSQETISFAQHYQLILNPDLVDM